MDIGSDPPGLVLLPPKHKDVWEQNVGQRDAGDTKGSRGGREGRAFSSPALNHQQAPTERPPAPMHTFAY